MSQAPLGFLHARFLEQSSIRPDDIPTPTRWAVLGKSSWEARPPTTVSGRQLGKLFHKKTQCDIIESSTRVFLPELETPGVVLRSGKDNLEPQTATIQFNVPDQGLTTQREVGFQTSRTV